MGSVMVLASVSASSGVFNVTIAATACSSLVPATVCTSEHPVVAQNNNPDRVFGLKGISH